MCGRPLKSAMPGEEWDAYKPPTRKRLTKAERKAVYDKMYGHCAYCGCEISLQDMQADHVIPMEMFEAYKAIGRDTDTVENMLPACRSCNKYKHTMDIEHSESRWNVSRKSLCGTIQQLGWPSGLDLSNLNRIMSCFILSKSRRVSMKCKFEHDGDCCNCGSPQYMCKCKPDICNSAAPITNADRIRAMSDEELARLLIAHCGCKWDCKHCDGVTVIAEWLRQPAKED